MTRKEDLSYPKVVIISSSSSHIRNCSNYDIAYQKITKWSGIRLD